MSRDVVAFFDFDGTLTTRDTLLSFLRYVVGTWKMMFKLPQLIWIVFQYLAKVIDNEEAKERTLTLLIKGMKFSHLEHLAKNFALTKLHKYINPVVYAKLEYHREQGHKIILVSANLGIYLRYWATLHKLDAVIATELEVNAESYMTGKLLTRNCYGIQKVTRIKDALSGNNIDYEYSFAYGNSAGDYELLEFVNEPYWVNGDYIEPWRGR
ncbi:MAG: HAD-IB family hydrolase [Burkholderiales bacterium]|nr:HAD-IB family hydrolase [Burkholderiales bacterium]